jgi:hypothetical protein
MMLNRCFDTMLNIKVLERKGLEKKREDTKLRGLAQQPTSIVENP